MKQTLSITLLLLVLVFASCKQEHFIKDKEYRTLVERDFNKRIEDLGKDIFNINKYNLSLKENEALKFLYAYMPLGDITNHNTSFYIKNIKSSFKVRKELNWEISDELFRHFVLPLRINDENLDSSRIVFEKELLPRIKGKTMKEAILEINHWCHEKVVYKPTDGRTSSPLSTVRTAFGRCGEESTLAVAAFRSAGIPARQVYTPRWAHTDNNHAWVEVWADGKWYFLGAGEPEPVLNKAWFTAPASRGMLMDTKVFGHYCGEEEKLSENSNYTVINVTQNYAPVSKSTVIIKDVKNNIISGAKVEFKIYNYAEFYTVAEKKSDEEGKASLTTGLGDMIVWASYNGEYGFKKISAGKDTLTTIILDNNVKLENPIAIDLTPPDENIKLTKVTKEQIAENKKKNNEDNKIRNKYTATFMNKEKAENFLEKINIKSDNDLYGILSDILVNSKGNYKVISNFLSENKDNLDRAVKLLKLLTRKDLRDVTLDVLNDNIYATNSILNPRVEKETLFPYKEFFLNNIDPKEMKEFKKDPSILVSWCKQNITLKKEDTGIIAMNPVGVWKLKKADLRSLNIFFVALARTAGINARKDIVTGKIQYMNSDGKFVDVDFNEDSLKPKTEKKGLLFINYNPVENHENPKYYIDFTISKIENGRTKLLTYDLGNGNDENGASIEFFKKGLKMDCGSYMLVSGTRMPSGKVLSNISFFKIKEGETSKVNLIFRNKIIPVKAIGSFDAKSKFYSIKKNDKISFLEETKKGYYIIGILGVNQEPTNHAMNDISAYSSKFEKWGGKMIFLFPSEEDRTEYKEEYNLPSNVLYGIDYKQNIQNQITANMNLKDKNQLPIFIIANTSNDVVFISQGYTIGLGERIIKVIREL